MIKNSQKQRIIRKHSIIINALKKNLFPLLCPARESEWLPNFLAEIIYSDSGLSEQDNIFLTHPEGANETVWVIPIYDNDTFIEMIFSTKN